MAKSQIAAFFMLNLLECRVYVHSMTGIKEFVTNVDAVVVIAVARVCVSAFV